MTPRRRRPAALVVVGVCLLAVIPFLVRPGAAAFGVVRRAFATGPIADNSSLTQGSGGGLLGRDLNTPSERSRAYEGIALTLRNTTSAPMILDRVELITVTNLRGVVVEVAATEPQLAGCFLEGPAFDPDQCGVSVPVRRKPAHGYRLSPRARKGAAVAQRPGAASPRADEADVWVRMRLTDPASAGVVEGIVVDYRVGAHGALRRATFEQNARLELCAGPHTYVWTCH